ncbi:MAG: (5-formylfuran-3-yl)methyl phosphate synthase, partial [Archaeoglobaceae archaeon]
MLVLVSPKDLSEALEAIEGGADIIDVKNPSEGSLGANFPWVIRDVANIAKKYRKEVSATTGDMPFKPGTASLAALGAAIAG